jgi:hypothetical protein
MTSDMTEGEKARLRELIGLLRTALTDIEAVTGQLSEIVGEVNVVLNILEYQMDNRSAPREGHT